MKKIRITFQAKQSLCGTRTISVIQNTVECCWNKIESAFHGKSFEIRVLNVEQIEDSYPSGFFNADNCGCVAAICGQRSDYGYVGQNF